MIGKRKKILMSFFLFFTISITAWFTLLHYGTHWLEGRIVIAIERLKKKGYIISYSSLNLSGNPLSIQATLENPSIKAPQGITEWQGQEINIYMRPWERSTLRCFFPGVQKLVVSQPLSVPLGTLHLEGAQGRLLLTSDGALENVVFTVEHLSSFLGEVPQPLSLKGVSLNVSQMTDPLNLKLSLSAQLINVEKLLNKEPQEHPLIMTFLADLSGFKPQLPFPKTLEEWRDGGGVLEVRLLKIDWPPILAEVEGTLTLDEEMYPLGSFSSRISGYREALNDMMELGWIKKKRATVAIFMLDLFSSSNEKGEKQLKAPITLQNKKLSIGPAPLLKLKPIGKK